MDCNVQVDDLKPLTEQFQSVPKFQMGFVNSLRYKVYLPVKHVSKAIGMTWRCKKP